jgi:hypothetical protein
MEYWLEPANLAEVRQEAGVSDPYWVPPPGWKPGDDVSPAAGDLLIKRQVEELAEELNDVKRYPFSPALLCSFLFFSSPTVVQIN